MGDPRGGFLNLASGDAWPRDLVDDGQVESPDPDDEDPDPARWFDVMGEGSRPAYQDRVHLTAGLADTDARDDPERALHGRGAFRGFQAALDRHEQHRVHWRVLSTERTPDAP